MALQATLEIDTSGYNIRGEKVHMSAQTLLQDAARASALAFLTVMAQRASDQKWVPLDDIDQAMTPANLLCGAIGGTAAEFAALTDAELSIDVDGETIELADMDMSGLDSVLDTPGYLTCAALAVAMPIFQAEADAQFGITIDGILSNITCDFSGLDTEADTAGFYTCGANGDVIANWDGLTDAAFTITVNGVAFDTGVMNFTACVTFGDIVNVINYYLQGVATCEYSWQTDLFRFISNTTGETSTIVALTAPAAGTDISAAAWLNGAAAGASTDGTGGEGTAQTVQDIINAELVGLGFCYYDGDQFIFVSRTAGELSTVGVLTAGAGGTDVSGAGFLNGAAGAATAGTGGEGLYESISDIINAHAAGRFTCEFNGDAFVFISPTSGPIKSQITVLSDPAAGGTYIGGAGFLNGEVATGTVTAALGANGTDLPAGLFWSDAVTAAALIAGDVTFQNILVGKTVEIDEDTIVLENSLDLDDVVVSTGKTIRAMLRGTGIFAKSAQYFQNYQPIA